MESSRQTKSDQGIKRLARDVLMNVLGLPHDTTNRVFKIIHSRGDWITVKQHVRQNLPTPAWQRVNQALDMIDDDDEPELDERDPTMEPEEPVGDGESDAEYADEMDAEEDGDEDVGDVDQATDGDPEDVEMMRPDEGGDEQKRESFAPTFVDYLAEISAQQTARLMIRDKQTRRQAALQTDMQRRKEIGAEIGELENSDDNQEKNLAMQIKRTAMLRKRVDAKKEAEQAQQSQKPTGTF